MKAVTTNHIGWSEEWWKFIYFLIQVMHSTMLHPICLRFWQLSDHESTKFLCAYDSDNVCFIKTNQFSWIRIIRNFGVPLLKIWRFFENLTVLSGFNDFLHNDKKPPARKKNFPTHFSFLSRTPQKNLAMTYDNSMAISNVNMNFS